MYIYDISLNSLNGNKQCFKPNLHKNQDTHFMFNNFFSKNRAVDGIIWKNMVQPDGQIRQIQYIMIIFL